MLYSLQTIEVYIIPIIGIFHKGKMPEFKIVCILLLYMSCHPFMIHIRGKGISIEYIESSVNRFGGDIQKYICGCFIMIQIKMQHGLILCKIGMYRSQVI